MPTKTELFPAIDAGNVMVEQDITDTSYACTVVSLLPFKIHEEKLQMLPGVFDIPAAAKDDIAILHVVESIHWIPNPLVDEGKPGSSYKMITTADEMARSLVEDYVSAHVAVGDDAQPGMFWVRHRLSKEAILKKHADKIAVAKRQMTNWFNRLIRMADADWNMNHNMMSVSDLQRNAATWLGIQKEWVAMTITEQFLCPFCRMSIAKDSVKCSNCKEVVNAELYKKMLAGLGI